MSSLLPFPLQDQQELGEDRTARGTINLLTYAKNIANASLSVSRHWGRAGEGGKAGFLTEMGQLWRHRG